MKHLFMLSISFKSHLIRHSGTERAFKDTRRTLKHLGHSESTRAVGHSEGTQRAPRGHSEGTQRALGGHLGTWALGEHSEGAHSEGTRALGHLRHLGTETLRALRHSGT